MRRGLVECHARERAAKQAWRVARDAAVEAHRVHGVAVAAVPGAVVVGAAVVPVVAAVPTAAAIERQKRHFSSDRSLDRRPVGFRDRRALLCAVPKIPDRPKL